jgi:uncharacterized protein (DUF433 family)
MQNWRNHITANPAILAGKPTIKGTRISLEHLLDLYASSWTETDILENYPHLTQDDLKAVFAYLKTTPFI